MENNKTYPNIDMQQTGKRIKHAITKAGYTPNMIKEYLHLSCVQPIYRWYKGLILPSVDHLFMLSELLGVHMEELLVKANNKPISCEMFVPNPLLQQIRLKEYCRKLYQISA